MPFPSVFSTDQLDFLKKRVSGYEAARESRTQSEYLGNLYEDYFQDFPAENEDEQKKTRKVRDSLTPCMSIALTSISVYTIGSVAILTKHLQPQPL